MFQLQFHWYGLLVGLGLIAGLTLTEYLLKKRKVSTDFFWQLVTVVIVSGLVGSRLWHVATDYQIYTGHWLNVLAIWNGGLSIIGTLFGAVIGFYLFFWRHPEWKKFALVTLDLSVFGLALGQAIGRLGNFANQELYGSPTNLPWSIYIDKAHRLSGFEQFSWYHPLFAYEMIFLFLFMLIAAKLSQRVFKIGSGLLFLFYVAYYSWIRFGLDFLRIDKATSPILGLGVNQIVLLVVGICSTVFLIQNSKKVISSLLLVLLSVVFFTSCSFANQNSRQQQLLQSADHSFQTLKLQNQTLKVEVVNTAASTEQGLSGRSTIGSDGMLFVFNSKEKQRFWMKEMLFDLDLIWLSDLKVVDISSNVPKPGVGQSLDQLPVYEPKAAVNGVLEVPAGTAKLWNLKIGDSFF